MGHDRDFTCGHNLCHQGEHVDPCHKKCSRWNVGMEAAQRGAPTAVAVHGMPEHIAIVNKDCYITHIPCSIQRSQACGVRVTRQLWVTFTHPCSVCVCILPTQSCSMHWCFCFESNSHN